MQNELRNKRKNQLSSHWIMVRWMFNQVSVWVCSWVCGKLTYFIPQGRLLSLLQMYVYANKSCMCNALCISQTLFVDGFNFILYSTERLTPVDFPSLCNSGSEVKWSTACANISQISALSSGCGETCRKARGAKKYRLTGKPWLSAQLFVGFLLIPLWLLISVAGYLSLFFFLSAYLPVGSFQQTHKTVSCWVT